LSEEYRKDVVRRFDNPQDVDFECPIGKTKDDYPSLVDMAIGVGEASGRVVKAVARGENTTVSDEEKKRRLNICGTCDFYKNSRCQACGCFINFKARLATENCIKGKW
jgi:hypothetical protein